MKKIEYQAPEMEVVEVKWREAILLNSEIGGGGGGGFAPEFTDNDFEEFNKVVGDIIQ